MKKIIATFLLSIFFCSSGMSTTTDGNGFLEGLDSNNKMQYQFLIGYVAGMYDIYEDIDPSLSKCLGSKVKMTQIVDAVAIYLRKNPQIRHYSISEIYPSAIKEIFNCKR